jgi:MarR family transcriptional regulator, lower aerobic nicotinate degradation pathway regulator
MFPVSPAPVLEQQPGHLIRRLQQIAVALFMDEAQALDLTPVQYAALAAAQRLPGMDQRTLAHAIGFDTSTTGGVIDRLEARGLLRRQPSPEDRRVRRIHLTAEGEALLARAAPAMLKAQQRIVGPLGPADREQFIALLNTLVAAHEVGAAAPSRPGRRASEPTA